MAMATGPDTHVVMGRIGAPYGIKGWVKLISFADPAENLLDYRRFSIIGPDGSLQTLELDEARVQGKGFIGRIKGCEQREDTRHYTGRDLLVAKAELPPLAEGYYWHQLEGLQVVNQAGEHLGRVARLLETGANDVLVVQPDAGSIDDQERLLPWVEGQVVVKVDIEAGRLLVDWDKDY